MGRTPDRFPGPLEDEEIILFDVNGVDSGSLTFASGALFVSDSLGVYDPRDLVSSSLDESHPLLRQLIHLADGGGPFEGFSSPALEEVGPTGPFPTASIWWTSPARTARIVDETVTYNSNMTINTVQWRAYHTDGSTVIATVTDTFLYNGVFQTFRTRSIA